MRTAILILAGGEGARIGGRKADKLLAGSRLIDLTLQATQNWNLPTAIQLAYKDQVKLDGVPQVIDTPHIDGPLAGLIAGLKWAQKKQFEALLTLPCDCPFLPSDLYTNLRQATANTPHVAIASSKGRLHPVCALWQPHHLKILEANAATGKLSLTRSAIECGHIEVEWKTEPTNSSAESPPNIDPFFNINTEQDLAQAEAYLASRG
ncbi:molybdenum cofactor guanylyltransferase [Hirschia litorea]|uniref:Molybdenum cofactor guanylyltransferase n=1 Tax=Hirschia litorea TaxID=1199156 RepID=A0ABW2IJB9_9PROT